MRMIKEGDYIGELVLPNIDNTVFNIESIKGKRYLLTFYRFASCPFCNLRINKLVNTFPSLPKNFTIVAVFDSPLNNLQRYANDHQAPFPILADEDSTYYQKFSVQHSILRTLKGAILRMPQVLYAMFIKGYIPWSFKGNITTMPLDILVDEHGVIQIVHYGKDEGDHIPLKIIQDFATSHNSNADVE